MRALLHTTWSRLKGLIAASSFVLAASNAQAQVSLNSVRITSADPASTAEFYQESFGLIEVNRLILGGGFVEIFMNFGEDEASAMANQSAQVVIMQTEANPVDDETTHVIFTVTDINATADAIVANGGSMDGPPIEYGNTGIFLGMGHDPAGNGIELIQQP